MLLIVCLHQPEHCFRMQLRSTLAFCYGRVEKPPAEVHQVELVTDPLVLVKELSVSHIDNENRFAERWLPIGKYWYFYAIYQPVLWVHTHNILRKFSALQP